MQANGTWALIVLTVLHFLVDLVAGQMNPVWPTLSERSGLGPSAKFWLLLIWMLTTSFSQLGFSLLGDSVVMRWLVWLGPATGIVCLGSLGLTDSTLAMTLMLAIGGLGIAAFHPEAATLAGNSWVTNRSRAMSIFAMGGFLGQAVGPSYSGYIVDRFGLTGLSFGIGFGLLGVVGLRLAYRASPHSRSLVAPTSSDQAFAVLWHRRAVVGLLFVVGTLRVIAASGVPIVLAFWLASRRFTKAEIGSVQSAFMLGIGLGGLVSAVAVRPRMERMSLWLVPLAAVPFLLAIPHLDDLWLKGATGVSGLLLGIVLPVFISYGQQLLPESPRIGSSITMGVSWGTGGAIVAALVTACDRQHSFDIAFSIFAIAVIASSVLCAWLPRVTRS